MGCIALVQPAYGYHTTPAKPQRNTNTRRTRTIKNSSNKSQGPEDGRINIRNMLSSKLWNNKASDIRLVSLYWGFLKFIAGRMHLSSLTVCHTSSFFILSFQLIFSIFLQYHTSQISRYFWSTLRPKCPVFSTTQSYAPHIAFFCCLP